MKQKTHLTPNDKFGKLTVIKYLYTGKHYRKYFLLRCDCGNTIEAHTGAITSGNTKSCGCLKKEKAQLKRLPNNHGVVNQILLGYKRHAKDRNLIFELTHEEFSAIILQRCYYCDSELSNTKITKNYKKGYKYNGIDRIDSSIGYIVSNVVPCCKLCNIGKRELSKQDFLNWVKLVYLHNKENV